MAISFILALRVVELASGPLRRAADASNLLSNAADRLSVQARAANGALIGLAAGADAISVGLSSSAASLEDRLARLATATETTTTTMATALGNAETSARDFSTKYTASVNQIIEAQFRLATAGIAVSEQIQAVQGAFKFARATNGEFLQSAELLGSFLNTFGKNIELNYLAPGEKVARITDVMSAAVQKYQIDMENLNDSLKFLVGPASTLGLSISETAAFAGALNTAGFRGTLAGTAISNAFNKIDNAIEKLDLDPSKFTDANGNLKDFASFLDEVQRKTANLTSIERQSKFIEVFDIRAGRAVGTLLQMKEGVKQFAAEMDIATNVTEDMANLMEQTTSSKFKQFLNGLLNISTAIGGELNNSVRKLLDYLKELTAEINPFIDANKSAIATAIGLGASYLSLGAVIVTVSLGIGRLSAGLAALAQANAFSAMVVGGLQLVAVLGKIYVFYLALKAAASLITDGINQFTSAIRSASSAQERMDGVLTGIVKVTIGLAITMGGLIIVYKILINLVAVATARILAQSAATLLMSRSAGFLVAALGAVNAALGFLVSITGVVVTGIAYLAYELGYALGSGALFSSNSIGKLGISLEEIQKKFGNTATKTARYASELERLTKLSDKGINVDLKKGNNLGQLPFAVRASEDLRSTPGLTAKKAIDDQVTALGGVKGILAEVALKTQQGILVNYKYYDSFDRLRSSTDGTYASMSDLAKVTEFLKSTISGNQLAIEAFGDGSQQANEALQNITDSFAQLSADSTLLQAADQAKLLTKSFEAINNSLSALSRSNNKDVKDLITQFVELKKKGEDFNATSEDFKKLIIGSESQIGKISAALIQAVQPAQSINEALRAVQSPTNQLKTSMSSVVNLFKNAKLGGDGFAEAVSKSAEKISAAEKQINNFQNGIKNAKVIVEQFQGTDFVNTEAYKDLQKLVDQSLELEVDLRTRLDEGKATYEINKFYALLDPTKNTHLIEARKNLADAFGSVVGEGLSGKLQGADIFGSLQDTFKKQFIEKIQGNIALSLGDKFKNEFNSAIIAASQVVEQAQIGGTIFSGFQSGDLQKQINDAVTPLLHSIGIQDIFNLNEVDKLTKKFDDIFTDASVKMVTATNSTAVALEQLQSILNEGPAKGGQQLIDQITRTQQLLVNASSTGATEAIKPIEDALSALISQARQQQPNGPAQQLVAATQQVEGTVNGFVGRFAGALSGLAPAAQNFISIVEDGFRRIRDTALPQLADKIVTGGGSEGRNISVKIESGARNFNVTIDGQLNNTVLDDVDIRKIVDEAKVELRSEYEETIRRLEDRLRGR